MSAASGDGMRLRMLRGRKVKREWTAPIRPDDWNAMGKQFLTAIRAELGLTNDREARAFIGDFGLQFHARVGGWTTFDREIE